MIRGRHQSATPGPRPREGPPAERRQAAARLREDRELSQTEVGAAVGVDRSWLAKAEAGDANLTLDALTALATALGAEPSLRLYPTTGPRLQDHLQVRLIETLLGVLDPRWHARLEVPVYRPARDVIDILLADARASEIVGGEAHSEIRNAERQLRWAAEKTDSLPSSPGWPWMRTAPTVRRLLVLRSTASTRAVVASAPALFAAAYPGRTVDAIGSLTGPGPAFPLAAIVWIDLRGTASRVLEGPPRGVAVGR